MGKYGETCVASRFGLWAVPLRISNILRMGLNPVFCIGLAVLCVGSVCPGHATTIQFIEPAEVNDVEPQLMINLLDCSFCTNVSIEVSGGGRPGGGNIMFDFPANAFPGLPSSIERSGAFLGESGGGISDSVELGVSEGSAPGFLNLHIFFNSDVSGLPNPGVGGGPGAPGIPAAAIVPEMGGRQPISTFCS